MPKVIVITGPCGAGKTTVAELLSKKLRIPLLKGDEVNQELFPGLIDIERHPKQLAALKKELLKRTNEYYQNGKSVIVDYIILGTYAKEFQKAFSNDLELRILQAPTEIVIQRDKERECWTSGKDQVIALNIQFQELGKLCDSECLIDTSNETAEITAEKIARSLSLDSNF